MPESESTSLPESREELEALLAGCIGKPAAEVVRLLGLAEAKWVWTDEPPCVFRGVSYFDGDRSVSLYIAQGEPQFRAFNARREWDYQAFLQARVGGIQLNAGEVYLNVGPAVPWQWRH